MGKSIRLQFNTMVNKKGFQFSFLLVLIYCIVSYIYISNLNAVPNVGNDYADSLYFFSADESYAGNINSHFWNIFSMVFPLIAVFPFSFSYVTDCESGINSFFITRVKKSYYLWGKLITCFIGGFLIIFIPFFINIILCNLTFPHNHNTYYGTYYFDNYTANINGTIRGLETVHKGIVFKKIYLISPMLYNLLFLVILSSFSGLISIFSNCFSYFVRKLRILVMLPSYMIFLLTRLIGESINNRSEIYIEFNIMKYLGVGTTMGQSALFIIIVAATMLLFSLITTIVFIKKDLY